ncbi:hypothetical protein Q7O_002082 [Pectobacterium carotovorum subsp. carotovorum PCCS1]|nr:hypothetical protein [Pectobacterium carotovorum subsp. carotovorum PCCS1]
MAENVWRMLPITNIVHCLFIQCVEEVVLIGFTLKPYLYAYM